MEYCLVLGGLILTPGSLPEPKSESFGCLPMGPPLWDPPGWQIGGHLKLPSTSQCLLVLVAPMNPPSWEQKSLMGYHT